MPAAEGQGRAAAILAAIRLQLQERKGLLDAAEDLGQVTVTVKLQAGTAWVRGVVWEEERVMKGSSHAAARQA